MQSNVYYMFTYFKNKTRQMKFVVYIDLNESRMDNTCLICENSICSSEIITVTEKGRQTLIKVSQD